MSIFQSVVGDAQAAEQAAAIRVARKEALGERIDDINAKGNRLAHVAYAVGAMTFSAAAIAIALPCVATGVVVAAAVGASGVVGARIGALAMARASANRRLASLSERVSADQAANGAAPTVEPVVGPLSESQVKREKIIQKIAGVNRGYLNNSKATWVVGGLTVAVAASGALGLPLLPVLAMSGALGVGGVATIVNAMSLRVEELWNHKRLAKAERKIDAEEKQAASGVSAPKSLMDRLFNRRAEKTPEAQSQGPRGPSI